MDLVRATVGSDELRCRPLDNGKIRLNNGEGFIICSLDDYAFEDATTAYSTPLTLELRYGYRSSVSKSLSIVKLP